MNSRSTQTARETFNEIKYGNWNIGAGDAVRVKKIIELVGKDNRILDIGCGVGSIGSQLIKFGNTVYGVDISRSAVKYAREAGIIASKCDVEKHNLPFQTNYFHVVIAAEIIEHMYDTDVFLEKIRKVLKVRGSLVLSTPNIATLGRRLLLLTGKNPLIEVHLGRHSAGHIRYFVKKSLSELLVVHGFAITHFMSDVVNFTPDGKRHSTLLATIFPTFGKSLIVKATKR